MKTYHIVLSGAQVKRIRYAILMLHEDVKNSIRIVDEESDTTNDDSFTDLADALRDLSESPVVNSLHHT